MDLPPLEEPHHAARPRDSLCNSDRQYSTRRPVSSEKHETAAEAGADEGSGDAAGVVPVTVVGGYWALSAFLMVIIRLANSANVWRLRTCGRLSGENTLLQRLAQCFEDMGLELRQLIQEQHPVVAERHLARQRHRAPPISPTAEIV